MSGSLQPFKDDFPKMADRPGEGKASRPGSCRGPIEPLYLLNLTRTLLVLNLGQVLQHHGVHPGLLPLEFA